MAGGASAFVAAVPHQSHPPFLNLCLLVFEAVMEVVCVSLPGYILARQGMFDAESQKFLANLNTMLFTPCLIFYKIGDKLEISQLGDLAIIPVIFVVQTAVSYGCARVVSRMFGFKKRATNFVTAMAVFGNSNSLPISLVTSLAYTIKGLHWDKIQGDNDAEVQARGLLYLIVFQQLGQFVRWSWGFHVLLAPPEAYADDEDGEQGRLEGGQYQDEPEAEALLQEFADPVANGNGKKNGLQTSRSDPQLSTSDYGSGAATPMYQDDGSYESEVDSDALSGNSRNGFNGFRKPDPKGWIKQGRHWMQKQSDRASSGTVNACHKAWASLPPKVQTVLSAIWRPVSKVLNACWELMSPPLWAMIFALIIAAVPSLKHYFFTKGTFVNNSVTKAIKQSGDVAVPLILVVLGANLARNTLPQDQLDAEDPVLEKRLVWASLLSRMLLPLAIMAPLFALTAKYLPISRLEDPIFVIVVFLLSGAPTALQLAQICQMNNVYMGAMSRILFSSYVVWILPSTIVLVMLALETVEWTGAV
ncbi:auxin efflux carrier superfamily protein-like protein [Trichodelitschia bisporula]|uniref:Auxin efflux carrier superfamily protein-like protein n=1 Tax=Trichodelitschia bisporula TaxID=703511 RepID=A0A6G1HK96_9PEZI|nr:auxin efflux carrier superfamily protein-like protein [Trichodelitschia bisporula]